MLWGSVVQSDDFFDEGFPPVGPVVDSLWQGIPGRVVGGVLCGVEELSRFDTAEGAYEGIIFCYYVGRCVAGARHTCFNWMI